MRPDQLDLLISVSRPSVHPNGWAVISATRPDFAADDYVGQLWRVDQDGARRLTRGFRDAAPQVSPDGKLIAFLRSGPGQPPQLAIVPADGGEPMVLTDRKLGVQQFCFTPDSARLVFTSRVPEDGRYGTLDGVDAAAEDPRCITAVQFQMNGDDYLGDKRIHVFVLDVPDPCGEPPVTPIGRAKTADAPSLLPSISQLTTGDADHYDPVAGDGFVVVQAARHPERDADLRTDLYRIDFGDDADPTLITRPESAILACHTPVLVGDDVYFLAEDMGQDGVGSVATNAGVYRVPTSGDAPTRLTDPADTGFIDLAADPATGQVFGVIESRGLGVPVELNQNGTYRPLASPAGASVHQIGARGGVVLASVATLDSPGELAQLGDAARLLTDFAAPLRAVAPAVAPIELVATSPDGSPVQGWVFVPAGDGPHPVLLNIHGGPYTAYGPAFFDEAQVYVDAGYAVVMCNPRGASSYGEAFGRAIAGAFGDRDMVDVMAFLDHALTTVPGLDTGRIGVMGGSYGGYLTAWIIAHEHRFAGAIVERAYLDAQSFIGASDIGWFFPPLCHTADRAMMDAQSPLLLVDKVTTPTMVLHSERDLRCPLASALRYFTELKLRGVETQLLVFPGETHELSRSGRPWHRRQRFDMILDWWSKYLS